MALLAPDSEKTILYFSTTTTYIGWDFSFMKLDVNDFFGLNYWYHEQLVEPKNDLINITKPVDIADNQCKDIMKQDVAIVNVQFATNRYTKTILDKRVSFVDRFALFGKKWLLMWE